MKRFLTGIISVLLCMPFHAQDDPVLMTVNGYDVKKSEFEYFFKKNNTESAVSKKVLKQYADLYLNFKLKVQAAIDEGLDKSESFLNEYKTYRDLQAEELLLDTAYLERIAYGSYLQSVQEVGPDGLRYLSIITITPQDDTEESYNESVELIVAAYEQLQRGVDFATLAQKYCTDRELARQGGAAGWVSRGMLPEPVGDIVFSLGWGEYSEPFMSDGSLFIIRVDNRRDLGSYEQNRPDIYEWMKEQGIYYPEARRRKANEYAERLGWDVRGDSAAMLLDSKLEEIEPEFGHISREYYDGLLLFDISNREVWEKASADIEGKEAYFKSHVKEYKFDEPCFKGMVFFCINEDVFHQVEDAVKGMEIYDWTDTILTFNRGDIRIRVMRGSTETGIIRKGQNAYVDKIVFGEGEYEPMKGFPYVNVIGKVLDKPENSRDVATQVSEDYQNYIEQQWVKKLRKQYKHKIYKKVLKKVSLE